MGARNGRQASNSERVEMGFLEAVRSRCPKHRFVLEALGEMYTQTGRFEEGLQVDMELTRICPRESVAWYNLGCSHALMGQGDAAFAALTKALALGYSDMDWMRQDPDLETIRQDVRFNALLRQVESPRTNQ